MKRSTISMLVLLNAALMLLLFSKERLCARSMIPDFAVASENNRINFELQDTILLEPDLILISPIREPNRFGHVVSSAGDVNGDGFGDFLVSDPEYGTLYSYYGTRYGIPQMPNWTFIGSSVLGYKVSKAGDVNGDGYDDIIAGNPYGYVCCFLGSPIGLQQMPSWTATNHYGISFFGFQLSSAGDFNNDGYDDIVIGGDGESFYGAEIFMGSGNGLISDYGYALRPEVNHHFQGFGISVAHAGDVNGDGSDEVILGSPNYFSIGGAYVYSFGCCLYQILNIINYPYNPGFGTYVTGCGDVDHDGFDDVMISTANGVVRIFRGSPAGITEPEFRTFQYDNVSFQIGEYNGDGFKDILSGSYLHLGDSSFTISSNVIALLAGTYWRSEQFVGDLNGDGFDDIAKGSGLDTCWIYYGKGECVIAGPSNVLTNSQPVAFSVVNAFGYWTLSNYDLTQATIESGVDDDTVLVNPGSIGGHFVLYYQNSLGIYCSKHVYVDSPYPVELTAFNSIISGKDITLAWSTSNELHNSGFEIQRAIENGKWKIESGEWSRIGFVSGNGTTNEPREYFFTDRNLETGKYKYRLKQLDFNGNFEYFELAEVVSIGIPDKYDLSQNYPNPFNPVTTINYDLPSDGIVTLKVYDILGRELKTLVNEMKTAGYYKVQFNAADLASGAYFYRLVVSPSNQMKAGDFVAVKKFVVLK